jgi:Protein of unknown function (DUF3147)
LKEIIVRFLIGGFVVSAFSLISDLFKPKTFAGLFGAAPSVALATLGLAVVKAGKPAAEAEARSMVLGAIALLFYASAVSYVLLRHKLPALRVALWSLLLWLGVAVALWYLVLV